MSATELAAQQRELKKRYKDNTYLLGKDLLGFKDMTVAFHYEKLCKKLMEPRKKPIRLFLVPRGFLKTTTLTITDSIALQLRTPSIRIAVISAVLANAKSMVTAIGLPYLTNQRFRMLFPEFCPKKPQAPETKWTNAEIEVPNRYSEGGHPVMESTFEAFGADSTLTSRHFDYLKVDDLVTGENCTTKDQMDKIKDFWKRIFPLRNDPTTPIDVVGTRWDDYDLYGDLEKDPDVEVIKFAAGLTIRKPLWPERYPLEELSKIKSGAKMGAYLFSCHPYGTKILSSDLTSKNIEDLVVGDSVVGWDREQVKSKSVLRLKPTIVRFINKRLSKTIKIETETDSIVCTPDHKWFTGRNENDYQLTSSGNESYRKAYDVAKIGGSLVWCMHPEIPILNEEGKRWAYWLGRIFDGEGHCKEGSIFLSQSRTHNPLVCKTIEDALSFLGFKYGYCSGSYYIKGGNEAKRRFALWCKPAKVSGIYESIWKYTGSTSTRFKDKILKIENYIEQPVFNIQTDTGNYIANGYMSKNCLYEQDPIPQEEAIFKPQYFKYFTISPDKHEIKREDGVHLEINQTYMAVDGATTEGSNDYSCIMIGTMDHEQNIYILDYLIKQLDPVDLLDMMYEYYEKWHCVKYAAQKSLVEKMLMSFMKKKLTTEKKFMNFTPLGKNTTQNKEWLIKQMQPWYEGGYIWHNEKMRDGENESQLIRFPKAAHDDGPDTEQMLLEILMPASKKKSVESLDRNSLEMWKRRLKRALGTNDFNGSREMIINERTY